MSLTRDALSYQEDAAHWEKIEHEALVAAYAAHLGKLFEVLVSSLAQGSDPHEALGRYERGRILACNALNLIASADTPVADGDAAP